MAKDTKGHGSEGRGGSPLARMLTAVQTMNAMGQGHPATDTYAANALGQDHPKSEQVPTHGAQAIKSLQARWGRAPPMRPSRYQHRI